MSGYWIIPSGSGVAQQLRTRAEAGLKPLDLEHCIWTIKRWFSNGTTIEVGIRVNPGDVSRVDELEDRDECVRVLLFMMQRAPCYRSAIEGDDRIIRTLTPTGEETLPHYWSVSLTSQAPLSPLSLSCPDPLTVMPLFTKQAE